MAAASHLHIDGIDMELAVLPEPFAERLVQRSIARCVVCTICTYRFLVSSLFVVAMGDFSLSFFSIPLRCKALKMSFADAFPE
jgi:hypothetical protein